MPPETEAMAFEMLVASTYTSSPWAARIAVPVVAPLAIVIVCPPVKVTVTALAAAFDRVAV